MSDDLYTAYRMVHKVAALIGSGATIPARYIPAPLWLNDNDHTVSGHSTRLRVRAVVAPNATLSGITFTFGLYPMTITGSADELAATLGPVVQGSTATIASPAANTSTAAESTDFAYPEDGLYALGIVTSTPQNDISALLMAELQQHWV